MNLRLFWRCALIALFATPAWSDPGAHGPNGEHLDEAGHSHAVDPDALRLEAHTDLFELVATLADGELSILIDRYETNEPVLSAQVEVEADGRKTIARFHADHGDYAVADEAFLQALAQPGEHAMVITVAAGPDTDLLGGVLRVATSAENHAPVASPVRRIVVWIGALLVATIVMLVAVQVLRRRRQAQGGGA